MPLLTELEFVGPGFYKDVAPTALGQTTVDHFSRLMVSRRRNRFTLSPAEGSGRG